MTYTSENLRCLLWLAKIRRDHWELQVAEWLHCGNERAEEILRGGELSGDEHEQIARIVGVHVEELTNTRLVTTYNVNILQENLRYLIDRLMYGQKKALAAYLDVHPTSISRWCSGDQRPTRAHIRRIGDYFELPHRVDLATDPLFLSLLPISVVESKTWLMNRIEELDTATFQALFPAFERMVEKRSNSS
jgi:hypothetical protein